MIDDNGNESKTIYEHVLLGEIEDLKYKLSIYDVRISQFNDDLDEAGARVHEIKLKIKKLNPTHQGEWADLSGLIDELNKANLELELIDVLFCNMNLAEKNLVSPTKKILPFQGR